MEKKAADVRQPMWLLEETSSPEVEDLSQHFDMFRKMHVDNINDIVSFAFIEHILRICVDYDEFQTGLRYFKFNL